MKAKEPTIRPAGGNSSECSPSLLIIASACSSELSSLSAKTLDVHFYERSFETNQPIAALAATSTKFGMTTKNIISQSWLSNFFGGSDKLPSSCNQKESDTVNSEDAA